MNKIKKMVEAPKKYREYKAEAEHFKEKYFEVNDLYVKFKTTFAPGHFYSPYPDLKDIKKRAMSLFNQEKRVIPGIDIREKQQLALLSKLGKHGKKLPHTSKKTKNLRYYFGMHAFSYTDATVLFCIMNEFKPKHIIEIGSGYSSAMMLDTNELFFDNKIDLTFIEPYPELLLSFTRPQDSFTLIDKPLHKVGNKVFERLEAGDILFIDSTHVSKIGSDVNQLFFEILPLLAKGVIIHIHDVFYPFEYPKKWIEEQRAWNEDYMLRAFLYNNNEFEIMFFNHFMNIHHKKSLEKALPTTKKNAGGSIWLRKVT